jgi:hypothetical protein
LFSEEEETLVFLLEDEAATELLSLSLEQERVNSRASATANKENLILLMANSFSLNKHIKTS